MVRRARARALACLLCGFALALVLGLGLGLLQTTSAKAWAADDGSDALGQGNSLLASALTSHADGGAAYEKWEEPPTTAGNYYLDKDVFLGGAWFTPHGTTNLYLNGHTIASGGGDRAIVVGVGCTLNIYADRWTKGAIANGRMGDNGGGVYVAGGTFTLNGGVIKEAITAGHGGGVYVDSGTFIMNDGKIKNNCAMSNEGKGGHGGGVYVDRGTFVMNGGSIESNWTQVGSGGGVYMASGTFTMNGGSIELNRALKKINAEDGSGGGVYLADGTFTLNGGDIKRNNAYGGSGGGMHVAGGTLIVKNGTIEGNEADKQNSAEGGNGGGVCLAGGTFAMSGGVIEDNKTKGGTGGGVYAASKYELAGGKVVGNAANNVYLPEGKMINVTGAIAADTSVGVSMQTPGVFAYGSRLTSAAGFTSDDDIYSVKADASALSLVHEHVFSYRASGDTITATCASGERCPLREATLTIAAEGGTYDGTTAFGATVVDVNNIRGDAAISYYKANADGTEKVGDVLPSAPTDAGKYWAEITLGAGDNAATAHVVYDIAKAANPAVVQSGATVKKGGNTVDLSKNVRGAVGAVSYEVSGEAHGCTVENTGVLKSGETSGTVTVNVVAAGDDNYEALVATPITVTVAEKDTQTITADDVDATFDDTGKSVSASVTDPATGGGTISYAVKEGSEDFIAVGESTGELTIKKAGTAYVTATAAETGGYALATKDVKVTVAKADISPSINVENWTYGDEPIAPNVGNNPGGGAVTCEYKAAGAENGAYTTTVPTQADSYDVRAIVSETDNYRGGISAAATFTIAKKKVNAKVYTEGKAYDGTTYLDVYATVEEGLVGGDYLVAWAPGSFEDANVGEGKPVTVNEESVWAITSGAANYDVTFPTSITATIKPRPVTVAADDKSTRYGEEMGDLTFSLAGGSLAAGEGIDKLQIEVSSAADGAKDAGAYPITLSIREGKSNPNYAVTLVDGIYTIAKAAALAVSRAPAPTAGLAYAGGPQALVTPGSVEGGTMEYSLDGVAWSTVVPSATEPGPYAVLYRAAGDANHDVGATSAVAAAIAKADLSEAKVELAQASYVYDGKAKKPAVKSVTLRGKALKAGADYKASYKNNKKPGKAIAIVTGKGNYKGTAKAAFTIKKAKKGFKLSTTSAAGESSSAHPGLAAATL